MKINLEKIKLTENSQLKLGVISDIHHIKSCQAKFYQPLIKTMNNVKPQFILIPGDIVDDPKIVYTDDINPLINFLIVLSKISPVIISKGNHEIKREEYPISKLYNLLDNLPNIYVLDNKKIILNNIEFIGFSPSNKAYLKELKKDWSLNFINDFKACQFKISSKLKTIMLCHSPEVISNQEVWDTLNLYNVNLVICGHMHNGLSFKKIDKLLKTRGIVGPNYTLFPKYCRGIFKMGKDNQIVVCKSLRVLTKDNLIFRFLNSFYSPNITILEL